MLLTKEVSVKVANNKEYYKRLGYDVGERIDKYGRLSIPKNQVVSVKVSDLSSGSRAAVEVLCDYCCQEIKKVPYKTYLKGREIVDKDCCIKCLHFKYKDVMEIRYGVSNSFQMDDVKEKSKNTVFERYGVEYIMQSEEFQNKVKQSNVKRYGVESYSQTDEYKQNFKQISQERYGVDNPFQSEEIKEKIKQTNLERYGCEYISQSPKIKEKARMTFYQKGLVPTSTQQFEIYEMLESNNYNAVLNYPVGGMNLDVAIFIGEIKIDLEYDGWYWHQNSQKDRKRDEFLKSKGWKVLRIRSGRKIPTYAQVEESINKLIDSSRTFTEIKLDDWKESEVS